MNLTFARNTRQRASCADSGRSPDRDRTNQFDPFADFQPITASIEDIAEADLRRPYLGNQIG